MVKSFLESFADWTPEPITLKTEAFDKFEAEAKKKKWFSEGISTNKSYDFFVRFVNENIQNEAYNDLFTRLAITTLNNTTGTLNTLESAYINNPILSQLLLQTIQKNFVQPIPPTQSEKEFMTQIIESSPKLSGQLIQKCFEQTSPPTSAQISFFVSVLNNHEFSNEHMHILLVEGQSV